ncbi:hypothetical protein [Streptomyces sp. NPDC057702]|uniref:hypothetical protein n=1 Tax=unclassified Streptomyces TaxID=2593676 RepID=UPI00369E7A0B
MNEDIPGPEFWSLVRPHTGAVSATRHTARGFGSDLTAVVEYANGPFFVKGMRNRRGGRRDSILRERAIAPTVRPLAPALRWAAEDENWIVLGYEVVDGRWASFTPGSPGLSLVAELVNRIGVFSPPDVALGWTEDRWDRFAELSAARFLRGNTLLHTDIHPSNVIVGDADTWLVDWAWPTVGAAFIDPGCVVVQLVASGYAPGQAEEWAAECAGWRNAEQAALDTFALAAHRMWAARAEGRPNEAWLAAMASATRQWVTHRRLG